MPDANEIHEHINNLLDGKLGRLANGDCGRNSK